MRKFQKIIALVACGALALSLAACGSAEDTSGNAAESAADSADAGSTGSGTASDTASGTSGTVTVSGDLAQLDSSAWQYNEDDDVYYQIGISYCADPADESYETLAVFVPGAYMDAEANGDGTYTCTLSADSEVNGYTAETAPIVMPINTPGYSAQSALTSYTSVSEYTDAGFVYVHAGCRGRDAGAPAGVTDLKAAVRYLRWCAELIPGDEESIFTFGMSGGGAQSAIMGATGDSALYDAYLEEIGAVQGVSDAVAGAMCWCPITNLDTADEAYEWMLGTTRSGLSEDEQAISDALAEAFAEYVNDAGFTDEEGNVLVLEASDGGIYQAGSYYDYLLGVIEDSLNNFLADTEFPYDGSSSGSTGGPGGSGGAPSGEMPSGDAPSDMGSGGPDMSAGGPPQMSRPGNASGERTLPGDAAEGGMPADASGQMAGTAPDMTLLEDETSIEDVDDITRNDTSGSGVSTDGTYETAQDYIDALNANGEWVTYDESTNTVTITSIADFVNACKAASKNLGAFDQLDGGQGENTLFGDGEGAHFDEALAEILADLGNDCADDYAADLARTDSAGNTVDTRVDMYTPLYYLLASEDGYQTANVAQYWRIRTGIEQSDCALCTEVDLALALEAYGADVDFETVWGEGHTQAERTGDSTSNFISWVNECMAG